MSMASVRRRKGALRFAAELLLVGALVVGLGALFFARFSFGYDPQTVVSIQGYRLYLIDRGDQRLVRDRLYSFHAPVLPPIYSAQTRLVKYLRGLPGDEVEITLDEQVRINGQLRASGLAQADRLGRPRAAFAGKGVLGEDAYWFMGDTPQSFDSRYWGPVSREQVIGRVYPLF